MAKKITLTITEDMIKLISCLNFQEFPEFDKNLGFEEYSNLNEKAMYKKGRNQYVYYGFDLNSLYGGNFVLEDVARILGVYDKHLENTEELSSGPRFPKEIEDYLLETHFAVFDNLVYIEQILHQFCWKGGITPGTYECRENEFYWTKKD